MTHTVGVITNPTSGSGRGARWGHEALAEFGKLGVKVVDLTRGSWGSAHEAGIKALKNIDALVVVGGDGMAHLGAQIVTQARKKKPLGVVAAGSGNDFAVTAGLPTGDIAASVRRIVDGLEGDSTDVDLGMLTGPGIEEPSKPRYFTCVLSAGIDAAIALYGSSIKYPRGPMKYKFATFREIPKFKPYGIRVTADGFSWEQQATLVAVANTPIFGGGLYATKDAKINDGYLDVVVAEGMSRLDILKIFPKLKDGSHMKDPRLSQVRAKKIRIEQSDVGAAMPAAFADGELVGADPLNVEVAPGVLRLLGAKVH